MYNSRTFFPLAFNTKTFCACNSCTLFLLIEHSARKECNIQRFACSITDKERDFNEKAPIWSKPLVVYHSVMLQKRKATTSFAPPSKRHKHAERKPSVEHHEQLVRKEPVFTLPICLLNMCVVNTSSVDYPTPLNFLCVDHSHFVSLHLLYFSQLFPPHRQPCL